MKFLYEKKYYKIGDELIDVSLVDDIEIFDFYLTGDELKFGFTVYHEFGKKMDFQKDLVVFESDVIINFIKNVDLLLFNSDSDKMIDFVRIFNKNLTSGNHIFNESSFEFFSSNGFGIRKEEFIKLCHIEDNGVVDFNYGFSKLEESLSDYLIRNDLEKINKQESKRKQSYS